MEGNSWLGYDTTAVHINGTLNNHNDTDASWSVEFAIPWKVLAEFAHRPVPPRDGDQWRVNFSRVEWRHEIVEGQYHKVPKGREDNWVWSPQGVVDMHRPERWGYVQFSTAPPGQATYRPDPAGPASQPPSFHATARTSRVSASSCGRTFVWPMTGMKLVSPPHRGTTC